jgi:hypothetical protein
MDTEDVEQVAMILCNGPGAEDYRCGMVSQTEHRKNARAVLAALGSRLLPRGGVQLTRRGTRIGDGSVLTLDEAAGRYTLYAESRRVRTVTEWPDGSVLVGPWLSVEEGTKP